jgi:hypothetical protein
MFSPHGPRPFSPAVNSERILISIHEAGIHSQIGEIRETCS